MNEEEYLAEANSIRNKWSGKDAPEGELELLNNVPEDTQEKYKNWASLLSQKMDKRRSNEKVLDVIFDEKNHIYYHPGNIAKNGNYKETGFGTINLGGKVFKDAKGRLFKIGNGITKKTEIDGKGYGVIESILVPLGAVFIHEVGHAIYDDARPDKEYFKNDRAIDSRMTSLMGVDSVFDEKDLPNIMGDGRMSENAYRKFINMPLRYGYIPSEDFRGGGYILESLDTMKNVSKFTSDFSAERNDAYQKPEMEVKNREEPSAHAEFQDALDNLPYVDISSLAPEKALLSYMKFNAVDSLINKVQTFNDFYSLNREQFQRLFMGRSEMTVERKLEDLNKKYKTKEKVYTDGRPMREAKPEGHFSVTFPEFSFLLDKTASLGASKGVQGRNGSSLTPFNASYQTFTK